MKEVPSEGGRTQSKGREQRGKREKYGESAISIGKRGRAYLFGQKEKEIQKRNVEKGQLSQKRKKREGEKIQFRQKEGEKEGKKGSYEGKKKGGKQMGEKP